MDLWSIVSMTFITMIASSMPIILKQLFSNFFIVVTYIKKKIIFYNLYTGIIDNTTVYSSGLMKTSVIENCETKELSNAIIEFITDNYVVCTDFNLHLSDHDKNNDKKSRRDIFRFEQNNKTEDISDYDKNLKRNILKIPNGTVEIDNLKITFDKNETYNDKKELVKNSKTITIVSRKSEDAINKFVTKCYNYYNKKHNYNKATVSYYYKLLESKNLYEIYFKRYDISNNKTSFDNLLLPEKQRIINLVDNVENGLSTKLGILLWGIPGTGKTSLIKAIAKYTNRSIIEIKLSLIKNDAELQNIFFSEQLVYDTQKISSYDDGINKIILNNSKRIYIFEDIDVELDIVNKRKSIKKITTSNKKSDTDTCGRTVARPDYAVEESDDDDENENEEKDVGKLITKILSKKTTCVKNKLTLSGILNTLDGIIELNKAIIIMTTNHPENLDPALIRHGRIDYQLELKKMTKENVDLMIINFFGCSIKNRNLIKDYMISPAHLNFLCKECSDVDELESKLTEIMQ